MQSFTEDNTSSVNMGLDYFSISRLSDVHVLLYF